MRDAHLRFADEGSRNYCRDTIERFLDHSWVIDRTPLQTLHGYRTALGILDDWMQRYRVVTLIAASPSDVRALLKSRRWDVVSGHCESLVGLISRFYQSLKDCKCRPDDPIEALINEKHEAPVRKRKAVRPESRGKSGIQLHFNRAPSH